MMDHMLGKDSGLNEDIDLLSDLFDLDALVRFCGWLCFGMEWKSQLATSIIQWELLHPMVH
jgi:hypothetical protein